MLGSGFIYTIANQQGMEYMETNQSSTDLGTVRNQLRASLIFILNQAKHLKVNTLTAQQSKYLRSILITGKQSLQFIDHIFKKPIIPKNLPLATSPAATASSANVLLVEDSPIIQQAHKILLENLGYSVDVAASGAEALQHFRKNYHDLILMDINLPDQSGIEVTAAIRRLEKKIVPIIMLTSHTEESIKKESLQAGASAFLTKPISKKKLNNTIQYWLQHDRPNSPTPTRRKK